MGRCWAVFPNARGFSRCRQPPGFRPGLPFRPGIGFAFRAGSEGSDESEAMEGVCRRRPVISSGGTVPEWIDWTLEIMKRSREISWLIGIYHLLFLNAPCTEILHFVQNDEQGWWASC